MEASPNPWCKADSEQPNAPHQIDTIVGPALFFVQTHVISVQGHMNTHRHGARFAADR